MLNMAIPWWEFLVRGAIVYAFLIILLRLTGKRQVGQLAPFDLVLLLVLSNAVQNSMNGGDNSLVGGLISATTLVAVNWLVSLWTFRSKRLEALVEGRPEVLIHNGKLFENVLFAAKMTHHELDAALRDAGCSCVAEVHSAILENTGTISVTPPARRLIIDFPQARYTRNPEHRLDRRRHAMLTLRPAVALSLALLSSVPLRRGDQQAIAAWAPLDGDHRQPLAATAGAKIFDGRQRHRCGVRDARRRRPCGTR